MFWHDFRLNYCGFCATLLLVFGLADGAFGLAPPEFADKIGQLTRQAQSDSSFKIRLQAAVRLGRSASMDAIQPLTELALGDDHYIVRAAAVMALAELKTPRVVPTLIQVIATDSHPICRNQASQTLMGYDRRVVTPFVVVAYESDDVRIRAQVLKYLSGEVTGDSEAIWVRALGDYPELAAISRSVIRELSPQQRWTILEQGMSHRDDAVRRGTILVLAGLGDPRSVALMLEVYGREMESASVKAALEGAFRELRADMPLAVIVGNASSGDKNTRARALQLLGVLGGHEAEQALMVGLDDESIFVRGTAVIGLGKLGTAEALPSLRVMADQEVNIRIIPHLRNAIRQLQRSNQGSLSDE